jgi:hypothetical protein
LNRDKATSYFLAATAAQEEGNLISIVKTELAKTEAAASLSLSYWYWHSDVDNDDKKRKRKVGEGEENRWSKAPARHI